MGSKITGILCATWLICLGGVGCHSPQSTERMGQEQSRGKVSATAEAAEEGMAIEARAARELRRKWRDKNFEEFERATFREPGGGKYIVSGDIPILDRKHLKEFFETQIQIDPREINVGRLIVNKVGDQMTVWGGAQKKALTYCVSREFGARYDKVVADMETATSAWERVCDIDFRHDAAQDSTCGPQNAHVLFDVRPVNVQGEYLARAFFPWEPRADCNVLIDGSSFQLAANENLQLVGILRHELGHTLGLRHEHTRPESGACFEDASWVPLTDYDAFSVMHYPQCNGRGDWRLALTDLDKQGIACLYGPAPGFVISIPCPVPPPPASSPGTPQSQRFNDQHVSFGQEQAYGPFSVSPGTLFEAVTVGAGTNPGDPDLYVRFDNAPNRATREYACRPFATGANEACSLTVPAGKSKAFVTVHGYDAGSYDLTVTFSSP